MKRTLILAAILLLTAGLASADPADTLSVDPVPTLDEIFAADEGGGCELPDFSGMSEEEIAQAALEAGFGMEPIQAAVPACPNTFKCNSITNCAKGPICAITDIGQCCGRGGLVLCCISGTIKVQTCPCQCTGTFCSLLCVSSNDVSFRCI